MQNSIEASIPDTLFKYCDEGALAGLETGTMMFTKPLDFNDPFEFLPDLTFLFDGTRYQKKRLQWTQNFLGYSPSDAPPTCVLSDIAATWIRKVSGNWFVTSLSSADHNVRMWAQYGSNHTGLKLTLKLPAEARKNVIKVHYTDPSRVDISKLKDLPSPEEMGNLLIALATRKGKDWEHEEEFRWFLHGDLNIEKCFTRLLNGKMKAFIPLGQEHIQRVTVGYRSSESLLTSLFEVRKKHQATWEVAKARLSLNTFQFEDEVLPIPDQDRRN